MQLSDDDNDRARRFVNFPYFFLQYDILTKQTIDPLTLCDDDSCT